MPSEWLLSEPKVSAAVHVIQLRGQTDQEGCVPPEILDGEIFS